MEIYFYFSPVPNCVFDVFVVPDFIVNSPKIKTKTAIFCFHPCGKFTARMEAKDGSFGFDFGGVYDEVRNNEYIEYTIGDGRKVKINFHPLGQKTRLSESFEAESTNSIE